MEEQMQQIECLDYLEGIDLYNMLIVAFEKFGSYISIINDINVFPTPDGDTGLNMYQTLKEIVVEINNSEHSNQCGDIITSAAKGAFEGSSGNSGIILAEYFHGLEETWRHANTINGSLLAQGLISGAKRAYQSVDDPKEGTILSVTRLAGEKALEVSQRNVNKPCYILLEAFKKAKEALVDTHFKLIEANKAGVVDAGALGFVIILEGFLTYIFGEDIFKTEVSPAIDESILNLLDTRLQKEFEDLEPEWEVQFKIKSLKKPIEFLRNQLKDEGNCLLIIRSNNSPDIKVHIHTKRQSQAIKDKIKDTIGSYELISEIALHEQYKRLLKKKSDDNFD